MRGYFAGVDYKIYQMSFFVGYPMAVGTYILINKIWPVEGLGIAENLPEPPEDRSFIEGETPENIFDSEKDVAIVEVKQDKAVEF